MLTANAGREHASAFSGAAPQRGPTESFRWTGSAALCLLVTVSAAANPVYVDAGATGASNGSSWADAYNSLRVALTAANMRNADADPDNDVSQIWVAAGIYMPDGGYKPTGGAHVPGTGDRAATFLLINAVALYGGFSGGETALSERDVVSNETIVSGDLAANDAPVACTDDSPDCDMHGSLCLNGFCIIRNNNVENSYHVVTGSGTNSTAILDGFLITAGNANGNCCPGLYDRGAGMINQNGSPTVSACRFSGNSANSQSGGGGALWNQENSNPTVTDCVLSRNAASAVVNASGASPSFSYCEFKNNFGAGMINASNALGSSNPTVTHCQFVGNSGSSGFGMWNIGGSPTVKCCSFIGNSAFSGGGMRNNLSSPTVINCMFSGNSSDATGGGMYNWNDSNPTVINCTFSGNSAYSGGGMINDDGSSPTVSNCVLSGNYPRNLSNVDPSIDTPEVKFSVVEGGLPAGTVDNGGNIIADAFLIDADGPDNTLGTEDDDLRLHACSPAIDAGDNSTVFPETTTDFDGNPRIVDGHGTGIATVDIGAFEFQGLSICGAVCGNGVTDSGEECDDGPNNSDIIPDACRTNCTLPGCGDGVVDADEVCEQADDASCPGLCQLDCTCPVCGDGVVNQPDEACDDGPNNSDSSPDACRTDCTFPRCGDGVLDGGEFCEQSNDAACPGQCRFDCQCPCIIMDAIVKIDGVPTDIGDIEACVETPSEIPEIDTMTVDFTLDSNFVDLCDDVEFHWFQVVINDDCPPLSAVTGVPAGTPYVDPPDGGYVGEMWDPLPWYDQVGADWCVCQDCDTIDTKSVCALPLPWAIRFRTWLVAHVPGTTEFCLIAGFEWARTDPESGEISGPTDLGTPTPGHVFQANAALANADSGFGEWTAKRQCELPPCVSEVLDADVPGIACQATIKLTDAPAEVINGTLVRNGLSVDFDGGTVIMGGALDVDQAAQSITGAAYVFARSGGAWTEQAKLTASDPLQFDLFGGSVAVNGDTAVVGSLIPVVDAQGTVIDILGAAYVFVRSDGAWSQQAKLVIPDPPAGQTFSNLQVAIEGDTVVVGANSFEIGDTGVTGFAGLAYVFVRAGDVWTQQAILAPSAPSTVPFGISVAVDTDTVVIGGAVDIDFDVLTVTSVTHVFVRSNGVWTEQAKLTACDVSPFSTSGNAAVDGDTIVVGHVESEIAENGFPNPQTVSARIFARAGQLWTEQAKFTLPGLDPLRFLPVGVSVDVNGDTAVVDQIVLEVDENGALLSSSNSVSVLTRIDGVWTKQFELTNPDPVWAVEDNAIILGGLDVVLDANNVPVSATGSAHIFECLPSVIDLGFLGTLQQCLAGPNTVPPDTCPDAVTTDLDGDGDIDLRDVALVQLRFTSQQ